MTKKKFNLTSDIIQITSSDPQNISNGHVSIRKPINDMVNLTLRVPKSFLKEYKSWCATRGMTMSQVIQLMYQTYKREL